MHSTKFIWLALLLLLLSAQIVFATELPPAPKGYSWVRCDETKSAFLKPNGWFFKKGKKGDTWGYVISNIPRKKDMLPTEYAAAFIQTGINNRKVIKEPWQNDMGPFQAYGVVLQNTDNKGGDFITHELAIGNDTTGTMYMIIFEAPAASWKAAWQLGEPMLQRFLIDGDI